MQTMEQTIANLRAIRASATDAQIVEGRAWYPTTGRLVSAMAAEYGHTRETIAGLIASYSLNSTWKANVTMVRNCLESYDADIRGLPAVREEAYRILFEDESPETAIGSHKSAGPLKRRDFYRNIIGRHTYVTCDRWHLRAAFGSDKVKLTPEVRDHVTRATRIVAREFGESASACQAVIWCAVRGDGK